MTEVFRDWPDDLVLQRRTPDFNENTAPAALQRGHSTKEGTWAVLHIVSGEMTFRDLESGSETVLPVGPHQVIYPQVEHEIEITGPVQFYLEFYTQPMGN